MNPRAFRFTSFARRAVLYVLVAGSSLGIASCLGKEADETGDIHRMTEGVQVPYAALEEFVGLYARCLDAGGSVCVERTAENEAVLDGMKQMMSEMKPDKGLMLPARSGPDIPAEDLAIEMRRKRLEFMVDLRLYIETLLGRESALVSFCGPAEHLNSQYLHMLDTLAFTDFLRLSEREVALSRERTGTANRQYQETASEIRKSGACRRALPVGDRYAVMLNEAFIPYELTSASERTESERFGDAVQFVYNVALERSTHNH